MNALCTMNGLPPPVLLPVSSKYLSHMFLSIRFVWSPFSACTAIIHTTEKAMPSNQTFAKSIPAWWSFPPTYAIFEATIIHATSWFPYHIACSIHAQIFTKIITSVLWMCGCIAYLSMSWYVHSASSLPVCNQTEHGPHTCASLPMLGCPCFGGLGPLSEGSFSLSFNVFCCVIYYYLFSVVLFVCFLECSVFVYYRHCHQTPLTLVHGHI